MVDLLALAYDRGCEAELANLLAANLEAGQLPDKKKGGALFQFTLPIRSAAPSTAAPL